MHQHINLTALLALAAAQRPRLDGTPPADKPASEERTLTAKEWTALEKQRLADKSAADLIDDLVKVKGENHSLRQRQIPEGNALLTADEKKLWDAYQALGTPEELKPKLEQAAQDRTKLEGIEKRETLAAVAEAAGWDADAFADLDAMAGGLEWSVQELKDKDGNVTKQVTVKDGDKQVDAAEFAQARWKKFLPVLEAGEAKEAEVKPAALPMATEPTRIPTGGAGGGKGKAYTVADAEARLEQSGKYSM